MVQSGHRTSETFPPRILAKSRPEMTRLLSLLTAVFLSHAFCTAAERPNIIFILADDWGTGDVKAYGGDRCKIDTPNMDRLAEQGMKFTDAHSSSAVCTPTRYGVQTADEL